MQLTMRHISLCFLISLGVVLPAAKGRVGAQVAPQIPVFDQIFKQPTGQNGYEELVMAGDLLYHNTAMEAIQAPETTLTEKRRALATPELQRALELLRAGLDKQIVAPQISADSEAPVPLIRLTLNLFLLARLLAAEQVVLLADSDTAGAIQNLGDGLRFAYAVRSQHLHLSSRAGDEIDRILIEQTVKHLDQFSAWDCDRLLQLIRDWLDADHSVLPELINERKNLLEELGRTGKDPDGTLQGLRAEFAGEADIQGTSLLAVATPFTLVQAAEAAAAMCSEQVDFEIANLRLDPWRRQDWKWPEGSTLAHKLYRIVAPNLGPMLREDDEDRARMQLLGVHVALRRYRWQYNRLPDRLDQLHLGTLILDPFTGRPQSYRRKGDDYELSSVGPFAYDGGGGRIPDKHNPISLFR
jgi:hypothetical protein